MLPKLALACHAAGLGVGAAYLQLASGKLGISAWERRNLVHLDLPSETLALRGIWLALTGCALGGGAVLGVARVAWRGGGRPRASARVEAGQGWRSSSPSVLAWAWAKQHGVVPSVLGWLGAVGSGAVVGGTLGTWRLRQAPGHENPALERRQTVITLALGVGTLAATYPYAGAGSLFLSSGVAGWGGVVYLMPSAVPAAPSVGAAHGGPARAWLRRQLPRCAQDAVPGWEPYASIEEEIAQQRRAARRRPGNTDH
eukprot:COSAG01_NODE_766_length_13741_cov_16.630479_8_plen_256_part_00